MGAVISGTKGWPPDPFVLQRGVQRGRRSRLLALAKGGRGGARAGGLEDALHDLPGPETVFARSAPRTPYKKPIRIRFIMENPMGA